MTPKTQAKIKPQFPQHPFFNLFFNPLIFNPKKAGCKQIYYFKF